MKKLALLAALFALPLPAAAQQITERLDSAVISAGRAGTETPVTFNTLGRKELSDAAPSASLPMALNLLPSVVSYNEGGTGLGNSAMTIRGSKGSQINVTLNGITLNDAESQEVFWVNIPSLTSLISSVQVQRGLGTSANGAGAFGASINMNTDLVGKAPSARIDLGAGSFGTFTGSVAASSGLLPQGFYANLAWNLGATDGYIRNAQVGSASLFAVVGWLGNRHSLRLTYLMGRQKSGITWDGIDLEQYRRDRRYNGAGEYIDEKGAVRYYPNQTDNYAQHHLQLSHSWRLSGRLTWSNTLNYTRGDGFDEYYKTRRKLVNFGFPEAFDGVRSDMIYRKLMDNDLLVLNSTLAWRSARLQAMAGVYGSLYRGGHWGEILWAKAAGRDFDYGAPDWYRNRGDKNEVTAFVRAEYRFLAWLTAYADLQYRHLRYVLRGTDDDFLEYGALPEDVMDFSRRWNFFNPRAGITAHWGSQKVYLSAALGHREPGRGDIKENIKGEVNPIGPERMLDVEAGYRYEGKRAGVSANLYLMEYWDMLLETGKLSSSGYAIKENVPRAWRRGVELSAHWLPFRWMRLYAGGTLSVNRIADYPSYVPYEDYSAVHSVHYGRTDMLLSPSLLGVGAVSLFPWRGGRLALDVKYVGKQFLDNSMREEMTIPAYWTAHLALGQEFKLRGCLIGISAHVNNLFNHLYYASGWRWESYDPQSGSIYTGIGVYPQAPRHFMMKLSLSF